MANKLARTSKALKKLNKLMGLHNSNSIEYLNSLESDFIHSSIFQLKP